MKPELNGHQPEHEQEHAHVAPAGQPWDRCTVCGLAEAAHVRSARPYVPKARRRELG